METRCETRGVIRDGCPPLYPRTPDIKFRQAAGGEPLTEAFPAPGWSIASRCRADKNSRSAAQLSQRPLPYGRPPYGGTNPEGRFFTIKGACRFHYKSARICRQRGIVTRPPRASSARRADRRLRHCLDRPIFQFHPTQKPQRPEVDAQGLFSRFLSSTVRSR